MKKSVRNGKPEKEESYMFQMRLVEIKIFINVESSNRNDMRTPQGVVNLKDLLHNQAIALWVEISLRMIGFVAERQTELHPW